MEQASVSEQEIRSIENYLRGYSFQKKLIAMEEYDREYFHTEQRNTKEEDARTSMARMKLFEIRHFVMGMENSDEKLLLYYHYVKGDSIERCSELLGIGRSTAFRMKKRALRLAAEHWRQVDAERRAYLAPAEH